MNMEVFLWVMKEIEENAVKKNVLTGAKINVMKNVAAMTAEDLIFCGYL